MDVHLLSQLVDERSPFGVAYTTRRLTLDASGDVTCDDPNDALWQELVMGIIGADTPGDRTLMPSDGGLFLDALPTHFRYHFLSPSTPLVYDWRGPKRPDQFEIAWVPTSHPTGGHGYQFSCARTEVGASDGNEQQEWMRVASIDGWEFFHSFEDAVTDSCEARPRIVTVELLARDHPGWNSSVFGPDDGPRETQAFVRAFLRRFFERRSVGSDLDLASGLNRRGRFAWRGGF